MWSLLLGVEFAAVNKIKALALMQGSEHVQDMRDPSRANSCFTAKGSDGCRGIGADCE